MKILKWVAIVLVVLVAVFVVGGLLLPNNYEVTRSATMNAPVEKVHAVMGDLNQWPAWGTWWRENPDMKTTVSGDGKSAGSTLSWTGEDFGKGTIEVLKSDPASGFHTTVTFHGEDGGDDYQFHRDLIYAADGTGTKVTWRTHGDFGGNLCIKWMGLFMDSMFGKDHEEGLKNAKVIIEASPAP